MRVLRPLGHRYSANNTPSTTFCRTRPPVSRRTLTQDPYAGPCRGDCVPTPVRRMRSAHARARHEACSGAARRCWGEGPGRRSLQALHRMRKKPCSCAQLVLARITRDRCSGVAREHGSQPCTSHTRGGKCVSQWGRLAGGPALHAVRYARTRAGGVHTVYQYTPAFTAHSHRIYCYPHQKVDTLLGTS